MAGLIVIPNKFQFKLQWSFKYPKFHVNPTQGLIEPSLAKLIVELGQPGQDRKGSSGLGRNDDVANHLEPLLGLLIMAGNKPSIKAHFAGWVPGFLQP